ncbi:MAG: 2-oxo-4-hydroxy-4-carboxy-5-ureidoimidazoline decarboxylase [Ktedonobacteraceae bacterium]
MKTSQFTLSEINTLEQQDFVEALGALFEGPPWIVEQTWHTRPFTSKEQLWQALCKIMYLAHREQQIALLQAHPDLVGRAALAGTLTPASTHEQAAAGLHALTPSEIEMFQRLNQKYHARFGFPFVICARANKKESMLAGFSTRLHHSREQEIELALGEVAKICALRLDDLIRTSNFFKQWAHEADVIPYAKRSFYTKSSKTAGKEREDTKMAGRLTTHVLNTAQGLPGAAMGITLWRIHSATGAQQLLKSTRTNANGRTDEPLLTEEEIAVGTYELVFAVGEYFRAQGSADAALFLDQVPIRFCIANTDEHYHVPLLVSPWAYSTYRGG